MQQSLQKEIQLGATPYQEQRDSEQFWISLGAYAALLEGFPDIAVVTRKRPFLTVVAIFSRLAPHHPLMPDVFFSFLFYNNRAVFLSCVCWLSSLLGMCVQVEQSSWHVCAGRAVFLACVCR